MKRNRIIIFLLVLVVFLSSLGASTIDEIFKSAKENSLSYQNTLLEYQNSLISFSALEEKDKVGVSVSATVEPLSAYGTESQGISVSPSVTVTLPNDGKTTITAGSSLYTVYGTGKTDVSGDVGVTHTFDFTGYTDDNSENLNYTQTRYSTARAGRLNELNFEKTILSTISTILNTESSLESAEFSLEKQETVYNKLVALKSYSESSSVYLNTVNTLNSLKSSLEASKEQYNQLLVQYKTLTGLDWDGVEGLEAPSLTLKTYENGNTEVIVASLSAEMSEDTYRRTLAACSPSSLGTSLSASFSSDKTITLKGGATYTAKNWDVSVTPAVTITTERTTPTVTISGSWSNDTSSSDREVNKALNDAKSAANSYLEKLSDYQMEASQYSLKILEWNTSLREAENNLEYTKTLMDNSQALYDLGLETSENLKSAQLDYSKSQTAYTLVVIEGLILERDLAIFAL